MNRVEEIQKILKINEDSFRRGVALVYADHKVMRKLHDTDLIKMGYSKNGGPTLKEVYEFMEKNMDKDIEVHLMVIDPQREDFRIVVKTLSIGSQYAKIRTKEDMEFWSEFMVFGRQGESCMTENNDWISWTWN